MSTPQPPAQAVKEGAPAHGNPAHLLPPSYKRHVAAWLEEDTPSMDYGGFVVGEAPAEARLLGKSEGVLAGVPFFDEVFRQLDCAVEWHIREGALVPGGAGVKTHCATVRGPARKILLGERVALNTLARCSGIATQSARLLKLLRDAGYEGLLAGTRKTTPGFRLVEKYGMLVGGCDAHRHDLSAMTMLKDNHVWACGGDIGAAVAAAKAAGGFAVKVEVECQSEEEAERAVRAGADVVMLDNFEPEEVGRVASALKRRLGKNGEGYGFMVEVSGGLTEVNVRGFVSAGVDVVSSSAIHQGVRHVDFSLKVVPREKGSRVRGEGAGDEV